jgi:PAB-dependent poly(A)-specific ribonuclease subunit 2
VTTKTYTPLSPEVERPARGSIIAIDAEFVSIRQQEIEVNSDGKRAMIRPVVHAVARISVIRGASAEFNIDLEPGEPFIDDYIAATEPVVDYLTNFSGISAGDLDPHTSMHHLVSRKIAYKKLWILLNLGCMFLGHGLTRDFRVINIHVPKDQVIDTSHYFFLKEYKRKLGLSFLSWFLLNEKIQQETHDSIEDARTALKLYQKYLEFKDAGILQQKLAEIYTAGREMNYKPPGKSGIIVPEGFGTPRKH